MQSHGLQADGGTYMATISACDTGWQWQRAAGLFEDMLSHGFQADGNTYMATISACDNGWQWHRAEGLFEEMQLFQGFRGCRVFLNLAPAQRRRLPASLQRQLRRMRV